MARKRFIKLLMSHGIQRNKAQAIAERYNLRDIPYSTAFKHFLFLNSVKTAFRNLGESFERLTPNLQALNHSFNKLREEMTK